MWGLSGPEFLPSLRRTRTLGLGSSIRRFNELAVPGLGGIWFGKQALLATLGVVVAEQARNNGVKVQNIEVANAIEALACWLAFLRNGWSGDSRLRGSSKLQGKGDDFSFLRVRQRNFYVTQPMRMATVQALPALGFVDSESTRFNAFRTSDLGASFIHQACRDFRPYGRSVSQHLAMWVCGKDSRVSSDELCGALSPLIPLANDARPLLRERLIQGGHEELEDKRRRGNALAWVEELWRTKSAQVGWETRPKQITDIHWQDLTAGARFFRAREAAIKVLDVLEAHIGNQVLGPAFSLRAKLPEALLPLIEALRAAAKDFLSTQHADEGAISFCRECSGDDASRIIRSLVERDGHVLRLIGDDVKPGPAFRGFEAVGNDLEAEPTDSPGAGTSPLPDSISYRMHNLYLLNVDLHGDLSQFLLSESDGVQA